NRTPPLRRHIDGDEHVARKQRLCDEINLAGVTAALQITRQVDFVVLTLQILRGLCLAVHLGLHHIPARASRFTHAAPSDLLGGRRPSSAGERTRSAPQASTAASNDSFALVTSVTTTVSYRS